MIAIINVSEDNGLEYGKGMQAYEVRLNYITLATFKHIFEDGMIMCLRKAAEALERVDITKEINRGKREAVAKWMKDCQSETIKEFVGGVKK